MDQDHLPPEQGRERFYETLLGHVSQSPEADFKFICRAWVEVSQAEWAYLWLHNSDSQQFELTAISARDPSDQVVSETRTASGERSIAMYCCKTREAVYVNDLNWSEELDGQRYEVTSRAALQKLGCTAVGCIPCFKPANNSRNRPKHAVADIISLHWRNVTPRIEHAQDRLINMGRLTALAIRNSQMAEQRRILVELNDLAQKYLSQTDQRPSRIRSQYLSKLIKLIEKRLHVGGVSIFYRCAFGRQVECIATSGMTNAAGQEITKEGLSNVVYEQYEGLTGCCFAGCESILSLDRSKDGRYVGKYREIRQVPGADGLDPLLLMPIPASRNERPALGVIRCVEHTSPVSAGDICDFNPLEIETLEFIARQVGPVLQTFAQRIERERSISIVKHDVSAPLGMIRDAVDRVISAVGKKQEIRPYDLDNIRGCCSTAIHLVGRLAAQPHTADRLAPEPTLLEGEIVARVCGMLRGYARATSGMSIEFDGFDAIPRLEVDREKIERALSNILLNAIKYGTPETTIEIRGQKLENGYAVKISNYGIGVSNEDAEHIFTEGFRSDRAEKRAQGLGLGLSITRQIMKAHGGDVSLQSRGSVEDPTVFVLFFPQSLHSQ